MSNSPLRYWKTIKYLKPVQIRYQIKNRLQKKQDIRHYGYTSDIADYHIVIPNLDEDSVFLDRFDIDGLTYGKIKLLHEEHPMDDRWCAAEASHLWNFNLHYLEFTIPLAVTYQKTQERKYYEKWKEIILSWINQAEPVPDAYAPYTISLRIPNILIGMEYVKDVIEEETSRDITSSLYDQYRCLLTNQELALLANHYFENLKAIVICSILFGEDDIYHTYFQKLREQIEEQILEDGLHFERSLMYHKIILEDILRIYTIICHAGHTDDADTLLPVIKKMATAMYSLESGFSSTPLFNDAGDNISKTTQSLLKECRRIIGKIGRKSDFPIGGYYHMENGPWSMLVDCGEIGPFYMSGHAHNDCLSFELAVNGKKVFTNSGTGQYQGQLRPFFRSTAAHNTLMIDDREQSELWGEHRAARRIKNVKRLRRDGIMIGQFRSYQNDLFRRTFVWRDEILLITDDVKTADTKTHRIRQFLHTAPGLTAKAQEGYIAIFDREERIASVWISDKSDYQIHKTGIISHYASEFGKMEQKQVIEITTKMKETAKTWIRIQLEKAA